MQPVTWHVISRTRSWRDIVDPCYKLLSTLALPFGLVKNKVSMTIVMETSDDNIRKQKP